MGRDGAQDGNEDYRREVSKQRVGGIVQRTNELNRKSTCRRGGRHRECRRPARAQGRGAAKHPDESDRRHQPDGDHTDEADVPVRDAGQPVVRTDGDLLIEHMTICMKRVRRDIQALIDAIELMNYIDSEPH